MLNTFGSLACAVDLSIHSPIKLLQISRNGAFRHSTSTKAEPTLEKIVPRKSKIFAPNSPHTTRFHSCSSHQTLQVCVLD